MDACHPEWRPFDGANERFARTPADSRLAPPVLLRQTPAGPFAVVFGPTAALPAGTHASARGTMNSEMKEQLRQVVVVVESASVPSAVVESASVPSAVVEVV